MTTLVNPLPCLEIALYRRTTAGDVVTITYAQRGPLESLWHGVMIVTDATGTTEHQSRPHPTPQGAVQALAAAQARQMPGPMLGNGSILERTL